MVPGFVLRSSPECSDSNRKPRLARLFPSKKWAVRIGSDHYPFVEDVVRRQFYGAGPKKSTRSCPEDLVSMSFSSSFFALRGCKTAPRARPQPPQPETAHLVPQSDSYTHPSSDHQELSREEARDYYAQPDGQTSTAQLQLAVY
ncbi:hypothetical protein Q1695_004187 [Nippostrongylus brasiliensis]|nr:hypothetical protein Q1695_004187 [Nippostrongylus brasiliensis]